MDKSQLAAEREVEELFNLPLIPGVSQVSPVLKDGNGTSMLLDDNSEQPGSSVGIVIADHNVEDEAHSLLAQQLTKLTALKCDEPLPEDQRLGKIGKTMVKGAEQVSKGIGRSTEKASQLIEHVREKEEKKAIAQGVLPIEAKLNPALKATVKGTKLVTHSTAKVSGFVADRVGNVTTDLSNHLANKMEKTVTDALVGTSDGHQPKHNLINAAHGGLVAYRTVHTSLETSAKVLGKSVKENTVKVVEVKYGHEAGQATEDCISAAEDAVKTYKNIQSFGPTGIAKQTAKGTGKSLKNKVHDARAICLEK